MGTQGPDFSARWQTAYPENTHDIIVIRETMNEINTSIATVANNKERVENSRGKIHGALAILADLRRKEA